MQRIKDKALEPTEWQTDPKTGERYRMIGQIKEYELMVRVDGIEIPQSELQEYHRRKREAEEKRKAAELEAAKNKPVTKTCPLSPGMNNTCRREGCNFFLKGKCALAVLADASGVEIEDKPTGKCPLSIYGRCGSCALYNNGCAVVRLAAAAYKE